MCAFSLALSAPLRLCVSKRKPLTSYVVGPCSLTLTSGRVGKNGGDQREMSNCLSDPSDEKLWDKEALKLISKKQIGCSTSLERTQVGLSFTVWMGVDVVDYQQRIDRRHKVVGACIVEEVVTGRRRRELATFACVQLIDHQ